MSHETAKAQIAGLAPFKASNGRGVPSRTFTDRLTIGSGADRVELYHFGPGQTGGDAWVVFPAGGTVVTGDIFGLKNPTRIDTENGGRASRVADTIEKAVAGIRNVDTVVTGHGDVVPWSDLEQYAHFLNRLFLNNIRAALGQGRTPDEISTTWKVAAGIRWLYGRTGEDQRERQRSRRKHGESGRLGYPPTEERDAEDCDRREMVHPYLNRLAGSRWCRSIRRSSRCLRARWACRSFRSSCCGSRSKPVAGSRDAFGHALLATGYQPPARQLPTTDYRLPARELPNYQLAPCHHRHVLSRRLPPYAEPNALSRAVEALRVEGVPFADLTESNPTRAEIPYPDDLLTSLADPAALRYEPCPFGLASARHAVAEDQRRRDVTVDPGARRADREHERGV